MRKIFQTWSRKPICFPNTICNSAKFSLHFFGSYLVPFFFQNHLLSLDPCRSRFCFLADTQKIAFYKSPFSVSLTRTSTKYVKETVMLQSLIYPDVFNLVRLQSFPYSISCITWTKKHTLTLKQKQTESLFQIRKNFPLLISCTVYVLSLLGRLARNDSNWLSSYWGGPRFDTNARPSSLSVL